MTYKDRLTEAMSRIASCPNALFLGQSVLYPGTGIYGTLSHLPIAQRVELPVFENTQLGLCTGLALAGYLPVCVFPRINFLLEATSQLVQHLDKLPLMAPNSYHPRVIIRTAVATPDPIDPGHQHLGDFSGPLQDLLSSVRVVRLIQSDQIIPAYETALIFDGSTLLVEYTSLYGAT